MSIDIFVFERQLQFVKHIQCQWANNPPIYWFFWSFDIWDVKSTINDLLHARKWKVKHTFLMKEVKKYMILIRDSDAKD